MVRVGYGTMRRALLALLVCAAALAGSSVDAHAGFDTPWHIAGPVDRAKDAVNPIDRCPVLSNPIECGHVLDGSREGQDHGGDEHSGTPTYGAHEGMSACDRDRARYMYHHPTRGTPTCREAAEDAAYHRGLDGAGIGTDVQVGIEEALSSIAETIGAWV